VSVTSSGRSIPRSALKSSPTSNRPADFHLARLDLGEVEEVVHELREVVGRLRDELDLRFLLGVSGRRSGDQHAAERAHRN
jgi:hypothetical protein